MLERETVHVLPINDLCPHEESVACACRPQVEEVGESGGRVVVHNSWDGREITERAIDAAEAGQN